MKLDWTTVLPLINLIFSAAKPALKQAALAELQALDAAQSNPILKQLIEEAEAMVAAA